MERLNPAPYPDRPPLPTPAEASPPTHDNGPHEAQSAPVYDTGMGRLTFDQLYEKTSRTVGYVMREQHGMTNPEDIDDCMQSGYLKVWQQLQKDPNCFADKPKRYIVQAIVFRSKAQRFSHQRHYHKLVYDADAEQQRSVAIMTTDQVDTWIDLERALAQVAHQVEDTPAELLGLYCLITQATMQDVAATFGMGYSTLSAKKRHVRANLAAALEGYGPKPANGKSVTEFRASPLEGSSGLVTTRLLEAVHSPSESVIYQAPVQPVPQPSVSLDGHQKPEKHETPPVTYPTRWGGAMTLEQIVTDPVVRRAAFAKAGQLGLNNEDREDCVQQGFIRLWQNLQDDPRLLADKGPVWVGIYVAYGGNAKQFYRHNMRQRTFTHPLWDGPNADEYPIPGWSSRERPIPADWTTIADENIDVNRFLSAMNQRYAHDPRKQIALQAVTGAISAKEAAQQLGMHEKNFAASIGNQVRQEVQALLPDTLKEAEPESWEAMLARGEGVEHVAAIAQEVVHNPRLLLALYVVTTSARKKDVAQAFGYGLTAFGKDIRKIKQMFAARYRRRSGE
jgi:DNA-directed RNA polymerase specialized sigma24 family protein